MTKTADLHALAKARAQCAQRVAALRGAAVAASISAAREHLADVAKAESDYQAAEDAYQRAISMMTNFELIAAGLKP